MEGRALNAYKFLRPGAVGPFSGVRWRSGEWVEAPGLSACERRHLPLWIWEELWEIELDGEVVSKGHKLRAPRARLGSRVDAWSPEMARAFARACARDAAVHAAGPLRAAGLSDAAEVFAAGTDLEAVQAITESIWEQLAPELARPVGMASDASEGALESESTDDPSVATQKSAEVAYMAAMVALTVAGKDAHDAERAQQADWLTAELQL